MTNLQKVRKKDVEWMCHLHRAGSAFYPGQHLDFIPAPVVSRLTGLGFAESFVPHNPAHKERLALTDAGRRFLEEYIAGATA